MGVYWSDFQGELQLESKIEEPIEQIPETKLMPLNVTYPFFNEGTKEWECKNLNQYDIMFDYNSRYCIKEYIYSISTALNVKIEDIAICSQAPHAFGHPMHSSIENLYTAASNGITVRDPASVTVIDIRISFKVKYFYSNMSQNDILYNKNFEIYALKEFRRGFTLESIINHQITKNNIVTQSLICHMIDTPFDVDIFMNGYIRNECLFDKSMICNHQYDHIIALIKRFGVTTHRLNIYNSIIDQQYQIMPNCTIILYKDLSAPYIEYKDINKNDTLIINVRFHIHSSILWWTLCWYERNGNKCT